jgi:hypothetical protein
MSNPPTRAQAKRNTLLAQGTAVLLAAVAIGVFIFGIPGVKSPQVEVQTVAELMAQRQAEQDRLDQTETVEDGQSERLVDLQSIAERLEFLHQAAKPDALADANPGEPEILNTDGSEKVELKYLGHIAEPTRQLALISVNGVQRIVPLGQVATFTPEGGDLVALKVVGLSAGEVLIERDGVRERVSKAPRMASAVTQVASTPADASGASRTGNRLGSRPGEPGVSPGSPQDPQQETDLDRRRREAQERRQRIIDRRNNGQNEPLRPDGEN